MTKQQKLNNIIELWNNWALRQALDPKEFDRNKVNEFYYDFLEINHNNLIDFKSSDKWQDVQGAIKKFCDISKYENNNL